jgi:plasmid stabilization system protein ParE
VTLPVRISEEADAEVAEAARWYETHRSGLGIEFLDALDTAVARISEAPRMGSRVPGVSVSFPTSMIPPAQRFSHEHDPTAVVVFSRP